MALKKISIGLILISTMFLILSTTGCSAVFSPDTVPVTIDLGLNQSRQFRSIDARSAAPSGITQIILTVSAPDIRTITSNIPLSTGILTLQVPAGSGRLFQVTAYDPMGNLGGSTTADLEAGTSADLVIDMAYQYTSLTINVNYPDGIPASAALSYSLNITDSATSQAVLTDYSFSPGTPIPDLGSGDGKDMEILVNTPSVTFRGTVTDQNLPGDGTATVPVDVRLYETKIIIPDWSNNRAVQIDDIAGTGWQTRTLAEIGYTGSIYRPADIDFDNSGRIYIVNDTPDSAGGHIIMRIDDMTATTFTSIVLGNGSGLQALAIDRASNILYYATLTQLYKNDLDGTNEQALTSTNLSNIHGLTVDDTGMLYIACNVVGAGNVIQKYNPTGTGTFLTNYVIATGTPWGVVYISPYIYAAVLNGAVDNQIIRMNTDFSSPVGYGQNINFAASSAPGEFYGPRRFVAILNRRLTIVDDDDANGGNYDQVVQMDDINGTNWTTHGTSGSGTGQFNFYYLC